MDAKVVLWAHNGHIGREEGAMGGDVLLDLGHPRGLCRFAQRLFGSLVVELVLKRAKELEIGERNKRGHVFAAAMKHDALAAVGDSVEGIGQLVAASNPVSRRRGSLVALGLHPEPPRGGLLAPHVATPGRHPERNLT